MKKIDLNVDIGEGSPYDELLLEIATSANVCCGAHAGSFEETQKTIQLCLKKRVRIGAHPGYPDPENVGRRSMTIDEHRAFLDSILGQVKDFVQIHRPAYLKPHGAYYNDTAVPVPPTWDSYESLLDPEIPHDPAGLFLSKIPGAGVLGMLLRIYKFDLVGLAGTAHELIAKRAGRTLIREGFVDRAYRSDGTLLPRSESGALLTDPKQVAKQTLDLAPVVDTLCLHGDTPGCVELAHLVRSTLTGAGYRVAA